MDGDIHFADEAPGPKPAPKQPGPAPAAGRQDDEIRLVSVCMGDMYGAAFREASHLPVTAFHDPAAKACWRAMADGLVFAKDEKAFQRHTGLDENTLLRIETLVAPGAGLASYLPKVEQQWRGEEYQRIALDMVRGGGVEPAALASRLLALARRPKGRPKAVDALDMALKPKDDPSVLLGVRYLNRGDGAILAGPSGVGKSVMVVQTAITAALAKAPFGIACPRPLRSLIVQAEDSEGDMAEMVKSTIHSMGLTQAEVGEVRGRVLVVTERVLRGEPFVAELRRLVDMHKPDLVWINPLQAYMQGDVTEARDLGDFLRGGLNSLHPEAPTFAYILAHHTTKPATGKDRSERAWHEVQYGMAGGAELINWARCVIILKPMDEQGEFTLVLAKRGLRAGVTKASGVAGQIQEPTTVIPLKHSTEWIEVPGWTEKIRCLFWLPREVTAKEERATAAGRKPGAPRLHTFSEYRAVFPKTEAGGLGFTALIKLAKEIAPISNEPFYDIINDALDIGLLSKGVGEHGRPRYWLKAP